MTDKIVTYTPEQAEQLVAGYKAGEAVEALALQMGKSVRSVIAKLSREGVYQAKAKTGTAQRVTKSVMPLSLPLWTQKLWHRLKKPATKTSKCCLSSL
jgi:hypothetical protein